MGFGYSTTTFGEIVFNTGMVGYTETLTDPSYSGQILTLTYPLVGNYGIPDPKLKNDDGVSKYFESSKIQARGLVVHELSLTASHWNLSMTLDEWMNNEKIPGISGIDTRQLTKKLRQSGVMMAAICVSDTDIDVDVVMEQLKDAPNYNDENFMNVVSTETSEKFGNDKENIVLIDTGTKNAIIRNIRELGYNAIKVPWNTSIDEILSHNPKGVIVSNGPGDPEHCSDTIDTAKELIKKEIPTLGICLGAQILAKYLGCDVLKNKDDLAEIGFYEIEPVGEGENIFKKLREVVLLYLVFLASWAEIKSLNSSKSPILKLFVYI